MTLLEASGLSKAFGRGRRRVVAADDVSLALERGRTLALVGESGAGKSTVGRMLLRLIEPDAGSVVFDGRDLSKLSAGELRRMRRRMQMVFQDPAMSLDPMMTIGQSLEEPFVVHYGMNRTDRQSKVLDLLEHVRLDPVLLSRRPSQLSGGQLQRVSIARSLATEPELLVCDEPVSALDVSVGAQITKLLLRLQEELKLSIVYVSHDLRMVRIVADDVMVMRRGSVVESGPVSRVFDTPAHDYTRQLLAAVPGSGLH